MGTLPLQTNFNATIPVGLPGQIAAHTGNENFITRTIEDAAGIGFGKAAYRGTGDHGITATPSVNFMGFVVVDHGLVMRTGVAADVYGRYENVPLMTKGVMWVLAGANVADGDPVYITPAGVFTNVNGGGANFQAPGWTYDLTVSSGAVVRIANRA